MLFRVRAKASFERPKGRIVADGRCAWGEDLKLEEPSGKNACLDAQSWTFRFVGLEHCFEGRIDWSGGPHGKLWDYNLHYFEWLWGLPPEQGKELVLDWIERHPYAPGSVGWEPYPLSLRIMNWLGYWGTVGRQLFDQDDAFRERLVESIGLQCDWLTKRLEKHLLGNHYLENGAALWVAGSFFEGAASKWKRLGHSILEAQLREQVLEDGMHFERSPMYHNRLRCVLEWIAAIEKSCGESAFTRYLEPVNTAALRLRHPDGRIALLNDSAFGIYPEVEGEAPVGAFALEASGYYGARTVGGDYIVCDAGRIGPDYIPGHAHCDIGSFELSLAGERFITDTGVYHYESTRERHYTRSTQAHNTFSPDSQEQAEIWGAFRVGRRPDVDVTEWRQQGQASFVLGLKHNGFQSAGYSRKFEFSEEESLLIEDRFSSAEGILWSGCLHCAPGVQVIDQPNESQLRLQHGNAIVTLSVEGVKKLEVGESPYYPRFNDKEMRLCITYQASGSAGTVRVTIAWSENP